MTTVTTLLVLTVGQTDVQLVVDGARREFCKKRCAALHDGLGAREVDWRICDSPVRKGDTTIEELPEGQLLLSTPKLDAVLDHLVPTAVLLLETQREASSGAGRGDPRFAAAVLEARLRAKGVGSVERRCYLQGRERLEDPDRPPDAVIRREVVQRLEQAIRETMENVQPSRIVVAATGGLTVVSNLVEEIVRFHASVPVELLEVADGARATPAAADRAVARSSIPEPAVSFQARRRALELVSKGNLLGAWAVAEPLHEHQSEHGWTEVALWLASFASSLPIAASCDMPVLAHRRMAVRAALRVELALRAEDIPKAVHGTVAFFEAALWDHLAGKTSRHPTKKRHFKFHSPVSDDLVREHDAVKVAAFSKTKQGEDRTRPFILKEDADEARWYWIDDNEICAVQIAKHYLKRDALTKLGQAVSEEIRELRNDVAHNEPTPDLMEDASRRMQDASLWSSENTFLSQPLIQAVLRELGEQNPAGLLDDLLVAVRRRLTGPAPPARDGRSE